jgi:O-Antigen ligase
MATPLALAVFSVVVGCAAVLVWRRPIAALYLFVVGLAAHNIVMSLLWGAGVRGGSLELIAAWKEILLAVCVARIALSAVQDRRPPFRPGLVDALALAFAGLVLLYAVLPQSALDGRADASAVLHALRHDLVPVVAFFVGRSLGVTLSQLRSLAWTILGAAAAVAGFGLVEEYSVSVEWWHRSGAVGYFRDQLGFEYHGPGGMPENFAFNASDGLFRRLISTFVGPLAAAYAFVVALLLAPRRWSALPLAALVFAGLLFTISRSAVVGLAGGLAVLALARRQWWPVAAAAVVVGVGIAFGAAFTHVAPRTHFLAADIAYQEEFAKTHPGATRKVFSVNEPSLESHLTNLRDGLETVGRHAQGYGLGNAGATAARFDVPLQAGESNYTEIGVETGVLGILVFVAWSLALLVALVGNAWRAPSTGERAAAAGVAAALAAVLLIAIQTDAYGVPWLGYCLWWLAGALVSIRREPAPAPVPSEAGQLPAPSRV